MERANEQEGPVGEREFEVWTDDNYPPCVLLLYREEREPSAYVVMDPLEKNRVLLACFSSNLVPFSLNPDRAPQLKAGVRC
jgi:hypothetical protein